MITPPNNYFQLGSYHLNLKGCSVEGGFLWLCRLDQSPVLLSPRHNPESGQAKLGSLWPIQEKAIMRAQAEKELAEDQRAESELQNRVASLCEETIFHHSSCCSIWD